MKALRVVALAAVCIGAAAAEAAGWARMADSHESLEPTEEEVDRRRFERWMAGRLAVREHGHFDMLEQNNGRLLRLGTVLVPRTLEVMMHVLNSPVLHDSIFNTMHVPQGILPHFQLWGVPVRLAAGGAAQTLVVALLRNHVPALQHYRKFKREEPSWPTYLDNEAAYTYLWRFVSRQARFRRNRAPEDAGALRQQLRYCYRNHRNEVLRFKYHTALDREKHRTFAGIMSQWSIGRLPVHALYMDKLDERLVELDRSRYAEELFDNLGSGLTLATDKGRIDKELMELVSALPLHKPTLSPEESLDVEARRVAEVVIRLVHTLMARMLEKHAVPAFAALKTRGRHWRVHGVAGPLRRLRAAINAHLASLGPAPAGEAAPVTPAAPASSPWPAGESSHTDEEEIEELLFESSKKFNPYWSMKNDTLYNQSSDLMTPDEVSTLGLLFEPDAFLRRLMNMRGESIDFLEVREILGKLTSARAMTHRRMFFQQDNTCRVAHRKVDKVVEQYRSLSEPLRTKLTAKAQCLLAFLYLFGVVDRRGQLAFPGGWPRDVTKSLGHIAEGIGSSCGLCNSLMGFLSGIGYPPVVDNMYAWEARRTHMESAVYQLLVTSKRSARKRNTEYFDKTLLSYLSGHYKEDDASSLAFGYYIYSGIGHPSRLLDDLDAGSGVARSPKNVGSNCIDALPYVIDAAKSAMSTRSIVSHEDGNEEYRSHRYAEFVKKLALMGDTDGLRVMGDFHYAGHEAGNIGVDVPRALEYWTMAAQQGDVTSALTVANHLINMMNQDPNSANPTATSPATGAAAVTAEQLQLEGIEREEIEAAAERYLNMVADSPNLLAASTARFYMARYGIGQPRDPAAAARHLQESADRGEVTSQMLMGHAYAGLLSDIVPADGKNVFMALEYYRRAAKSGNIVATFNTAVLTLHGYDLKYNTSLDRCKASFGMFQQVGRRAVLPATVAALAQRAAHYGDHIGHSLMSMFLSEMGDPNAHMAAAQHFKKSQHLCYAGDGGAAEASAGADKAATTAARPLGIFAPFQQAEQPEGPSACHLFYARRSGHESAGGSPLLLAEALLDTDPQESLAWVMEAKQKNEPKANYLYATMLEAGVGIVQDCQASYSYYSAMTDSRDYPSKMLGFLCIQRTRASRLLHGWPELYESFVTTFYDQAIWPRLMAKDYQPCRYDLPRPQPIEVVGDLLITSVFLVVLLFSTVVYLKIN